MISEENSVILFCFADASDLPWKAVTVNRCDNQS